jgi:hypothetical protein
MIDLTPRVLRLIAAGVVIPPSMIQAAQDEVAMARAGAVPTIAQQDVWDLELDRALTLLASVT